MSAPMNGVAILRAIKGVVAGELGSKRKVVGSGGQPLCAYAPSVIEIENPVEEAVFFTTGHWFDLRVSPHRDDPSTMLSVKSNVAHKLLDVAVVGLTSGGKGQDFSIDAQGAALDVVHKICSALGYPGNVYVDDRGQQTGIIEGCLVGPNGSPGNPVGVLGERDCHLIAWRVNGAAKLQLEQEV